MICTRCGGSFDVNLSAANRYPGWQPSLCSTCHRGATTSVKNGTLKSKPRTNTPPAVGIDEVLARYTDGPVSGVFTDGSAQPNPGPGGWGAVYVKNNQVIDQRWGSVPATTNNRMELQALAVAAELVPDGERTTIFTDSKLAVDTINTWAASWEKRGWKRKSGPVENLDLVKPLFHTFRHRPELELRWIQAHTGYRWNEYADALATAWTRETL